MATRFYISAAAETVPISPTPDSAWEDTSILARVLAVTAKRSNAMTTVSFSDVNAANRDILFRQHISSALTVGQTITGAQAIKAQCRSFEDNAGNNLFMALGIRVLASDGTTVQKTVLSVTRDNVEASTVTLTNRQFTATSAATDYTTVAGDRLVFEIGMAGDPAIGLSHTSDMSFGDDAVFDLSEDDLTITAFNPWIELTDTLTFVSVTAVPRSYGVVIG
jgi:hypothetical protein